MKTQVTSQWSHAVLVCKKCSKKLKGGFGSDGNQKLAKTLRKHLNVKKGRKGDVGVVEVPCLDVCPKGGVVVINSRCPGSWRIIQPQTDIAKVSQEIDDMCF